MSSADMEVARELRQPTGGPQGARKILVTGGSRSGKTRFALAQAEALGPARTYLATAEAWDDEMRARIQRHQAERGVGWTTVEEPLDVEPLLDRSAVVLLDCLTLWVSNLLGAKGMEADLRPRIDALVAAFQAASGSVLLVTNEVGMGLVPETPLGRRFRDWAGILAQEASRVADEVYLLCAGLPLRLK